MLQVRHLPDDVHAKLKMRAAAARMSLSDYVAHELGELVKYRPNEEIFAEARRRAIANPSEHPVSAADAIAAERAERDERWHEHMSSTRRPY